jgi:hypothetical protein
LPLLRATTQGCAGDVGCFTTTTVYTWPSGSDVGKVNAPFSRIERSVEFIRITSPELLNPLTVPPTVKPVSALLL